MTPAPISVERLRQLLVAHPSIPTYHIEDQPVVNKILEALPALLHQLAERDAEVERLRDAMRDADAAFLAMLERAEAAERAREEACKLLQECEGNLYHPHAPSQISALEDRIAAFLAASGGR